MVLLGEDSSHQQQHQSAERDGFVSFLALGRDCIYKPRKKRGPKKRVRSDSSETSPAAKKKKTSSNNGAAGNESQQHNSFMPNYQQNGGTTPFHRSAHAAASQQNVDRNTQQQPPSYFGGGAMPPNMGSSQSLNFSLNPQFYQHQLPSSHVLHHPQQQRQQNGYSHPSGLPLQNGALRQFQGGASTNQQNMISQQSFQPSHNNNSSQFFSRNEHSFSSPAISTQAPSASGTGHHAPTTSTTTVLPPSNQYNQKQSPPSKQQNTADSGTTSNDTNNTSGSNTQITEVSKSGTETDENDLLDPFVYDDHQSTLSMYYSTLLSQWIDTYDLYITPGHSMLPVHRKSFHTVVPQLLKDLLVDNPNAKENNFFLCSLLANSATFMGDASFGRSFFRRARLLAGNLFDVIDYRVGLGFMLLCFYSFVNMDFQNAMTYLRLAHNVASYFPPNCHLAKHCTVASMYMLKSDEERLQKFHELGQGESATLADILWSTVGAASLRAESKPERAAQELPSIEDALKLLTPENVNNGQLSMWHWFYAHSHRVSVLLLSGQVTEAVEAAEVLLSKTDNSMWKYFNLPMRTRILRVIGQTLLAIPDKLSSDAWKNIGTLYARMEDLLKFPISVARLSDVMKQLEKRRCDEVEAELNIGVSTADDADLSNLGGGGDSNTADIFSGADDSLTSDNLLD